MEKWEKMAKMILFSCVLMVAGFSAGAQGRFSMNRIPLNQPLNVTILGSDTTLLFCYNLYGFSYTSDTDSLQGEFIVPIDADTFRNKTIVSLKLCEVKEFAVRVGKKCRKIPVEGGIQLKFPDREEEVYLNFDPSGPSPVFIPCK